MSDSPRPPSRVPFTARRFHPRDRRMDALARYGVAVLAIGATLVAKLALRPLLETGIEHEAPFMLSLAAVMVSGWYGGLGPGLVATGLAAAIGDYFFMDPTYHLGVVNRAQQLRLMIFIAEGTVVSVLCQTLDTARRRAEANETEARNLQRELLDTTDTEQRRIGHDLHDGLGQHLTGIAFMSKLIEQRLAARGVPEADEARRISGLVNKAIGWTRDLARGLAPVDLDQEEGLVSALRQLTEGTAEMFGAPCRLETAGDVRFRNPTVAIHLYRVAQEAVNNAIKHAQAKEVVVRLIRDARGLTVSVEDDGRGFDLAAAAVQSGGMGLRIMRYRARMIAGTLDVRRRAGGGTAVTCSCPLAAPPSAAVAPREEPVDAQHAQQQAVVGREDR